ncbi:MAG: DNA double-strand break repair nuclease NurA [Fimbriimonadaceae bacterium]|nr:DNA double-strand break repair nuclease NurA [Fimbriimonadaceae bacterium]
MLKLAELYAPVQRLAGDSAGLAAAQAASATATVAALRHHAAQTAAWRERAAAARTSWLVADCLEPPDTAAAPGDLPPQWTVLAVDGSQIFPDRHGLAPCYVLNFGLITLRYGAASSALLDSSPVLCAAEEDLYLGAGAARRAIGPEEVSIVRAVQELERLVALAQEQPPEPLLALCDGSLIPWSLDRADDPWRQAMLARYLDALAACEELQIPLVGYISRSRASDLVHLVRVAECDQTPVNCDRCPHLAALTGDLPRGRVLPQAAAAQLPCGGPAGLCDADLAQRLLQPGQRSALFATCSRACGQRDELRARFVYLHTGDEIARLEFLPSQATPPRLAALHALVWDQLIKGQGYPLALREAHEQAVLRAADRAAFDRLLEQALVSRQVMVRWSAKGRSKERPGV